MADSDQKMDLVACQYEIHGPAILEIFNEAILNSTVIFDYRPRTMESLEAWFRQKEADKFPVIGLCSSDGVLLGFATFGTFRAWPAYKYTVEHSVYVKKEYRGKGIGPKLMGHVIEAAKEQQYHVMIGCIEVSNKGSIALHEKLGFSHSGTITQAGFKFGRWLDVSFYQLTLNTPQFPVDG